jgi:hypothetical protein
MRRFLFPRRLQSQESLPSLQERVQVRHHKGITASWCMQDRRALPPFLQQLAATLPVMATLPPPPQVKR